MGFAGNYFSPSKVSNQTIEPTFRYMAGGVWDELFFSFADSISNLERRVT